MSYLNSTRLVFFGRFQADVSTVNNDVRHFDNSAFIDDYQKFQASGDQLNGWWNPVGSGAFRLVDCLVRAVHYADGTSAEQSQQDPVVGATLGGADDRVSGKIVDLDPQWQLASQLWGLGVRLVDDAGATIVGGEYAPNAFRDLTFSRIPARGGDSGASAYFQSVLTDLEWGQDIRRSRLIEELRRITQSGKLSIRLMTYGFQDAHGKAGFTYGSLSGVIGPYLDGEPDSFVVGRRFTPAAGASSWNGINFFSGALDSQNTLLLDLGNALPLHPDKTPIDLGELTAGYLLNSGLPEGSPLGPGSFAPIGTIPYRDAGWLEKTGGVAAFPSPAPMPGTPLALVVNAASAGTAAAPAALPTIAIRESANGLFVGAEPFVLRIDAGKVATTTFHAAQFGKPMAFAEIGLAQVGEMPGLGGNGPLKPPVPIPVAGIPQTCLLFPSGVGTDENGVATVRVGTLPPNNPRGYIDGQLYNITFQLSGQSRQSFGPFEVIAIHLRDAYKVPDQPTWAAHIQPIFVQYGNLYPIMSQRLVNLNDPLSVWTHRKLLSLAFSTEIEDPNYMPVTRDLSAAKRATIVKWLASLDAGGDLAFLALVDAPKDEQRAPLTVFLPPQPTTPIEEPKSGKSTFAAGLALSRQSSRRI